MATMKLLGNQYLGSEYSATEARVFFEVYKNEGCNAAHIAEVMNIDKSYLSKIIINYEKNGFILRVSSIKDRRSYDLFLTEKGKIRVQELIIKSNNEIKKILDHISEDKLIQIEHALDTIVSILKSK